MNINCGSMYLKPYGQNCGIHKNTRILKQQKFYQETAIAAEANSVFL